jgi:hypothetical protein
MYEGSGGQPYEHQKGGLGGGSTILPTLSEGLEIVLADFDAENAMLNGDYWWQIVTIVIEGNPSILEVCGICLFMSLSRILLKGSVRTNPFYQMRYQVDLGKVEVGI